MRGISTLGNAMERVHEMSVRNHDENIRVSEMEFERLDRMRLSGKEVEVLPSAQHLLANRLRVPHSYLSRCPQELQAQNLNYWIKEEAKTRDVFFCRFNGEELRAVFTDRYTVIDHMEILAKMLEYGFDPGTEVHYSLDSSLLVLKIPDFTRKFGLGKEEIVPGISIANSEVGVVALHVEAYFYRLVCSNGLIAKTAIASRYRHITTKALEEFPRILGQVAEESQRSQRHFQISLQSKVDNPLASIGSFAGQFNLTKKESQSVQSAWEMEQGFTLFHVINAFTRGANDSSLNTEESYRLERVAGLILSMAKEN